MKRFTIVRGFLAAIFVLYLQGTVAWAQSASATGTNGGAGGTTSQTTGQPAAEASASQDCEKIKADIRQLQQTLADLSAEVQKLTNQLDTVNQHISQIQAAVKAATDESNGQSGNQRFIGTNPFEIERGQQLDSLAYEMAIRKELKERIEDDTSAMQRIKDNIADLLNQLGSCGPKNEQKSPKQELPKQQLDSSKPAAGFATQDALANSVGTPVEAHDPGGAKPSNSPDQPCDCSEKRKALEQAQAAAAAAKQALDSAQDELDQANELNRRADLYSEAGDINYRASVDYSDKAEAAEAQAKADSPNFNSWMFVYEDDVALSQSYLTAASENYADANDFRGQADKLLADHKAKEEALAQKENEAKQADEAYAKCLAALAANPKCNDKTQAAVPSVPDKPARPKVPAPASSNAIPQLPAGSNAPKYVTPSGSSTSRLTPTPGTKSVDVGFLVPHDRSAGPISGTVVTNPDKHKNDPGLDLYETTVSVPDSGSIEGLAVETSDGALQPIDKAVIIGLLGGAGATAIALVETDQPDKPLASLTVPSTPATLTEPTMPTEPTTPPLRTTPTSDSPMTPTGTASQVQPVKYTTPATNTSTVQEIRGPMSGNSNLTNVTLNGQSARIVAAKPGTIYVDMSNAKVGLNEIHIQTAGQEEVSLTTRKIQTTATVGTNTLHRMQTTEIVVTVDAGQVPPSEKGVVSVHLVNESATVIRILGKTDLSFSGKELAKGPVTARVKIQAIGTGPFDLDWRTEASFPDSEAPARTAVSEKLLAPYPIQRLASLPSNN